MSDKSDTQQVLEDILSQRAFEKLDLFSNGARLNELNQKEKELLAEIFVLQAESFLKTGITQDVYTSIKVPLEQAMQLIPLSYKLWYKKGILLSLFPFDEAQELAALAFEMSTSLNSTHFESFFSWAVVLFRRTLFSNDVTYLVHSDEKFKVAQELLLSNQTTVSRETLFSFYWKWGVMLFVHYRHSQEPYELCTAIDRYLKAMATEVEEGGFFNDFANAVVEYATLFDRTELIPQTVLYYTKSLALIESPDRIDHDELALRYFNLGCCYHYLFEEHLQEICFKQAKLCYMQSLKYSPSFLQAHSKLGFLYLLAGKVWQDPFFFEESAGFLAKVYAAEATPKVIERYAEVLALLGANKDNINLLLQAKHILELGKKKYPDSKDFLPIEIFVQLEQAKYFQDEAMCLEAVGLAGTMQLSERKDSAICFSLGQAKTYLGILQSDIEQLREALLLYYFASKSELGKLCHFWNDWGLALLAIADLSHNIKYVEEAAEKFGRAILMQDVVHPDWLLNYGGVLDLLGDLTDDETQYERAISVLSTCLSLDPVSPSAHMQLGLAYMHLGEASHDEEHFYKALEHFEWLVKEDPEDEFAHHEIALACLHIVEKADDADRAYLLYTTHMHLHAAALLGNTHAYYTLACLYSLKENEERALDCLEKAIQYDALPPVEDIAQDKWLDFIKDTEHFRELISHLERLEKKRAE